MTQETYRVKRERVDKDEKKEDEDKKKKSVAFKASSSSKNKGKKQEASDDKDASDIDDEAMALFVRKFGKFMKKKGYGARKRRDNKSKEYVRRCYNCKSLNHIATDCPYNSDNDEDEKKQKKEKKEKKMTF
jgi:hypothetical protein